MKSQPWKRSDPASAAGFGRQVILVLILISFLAASGASPAASFGLFSADGPRAWIARGGFGGAVLVVEARRRRFRLWRFWWRELGGGAPGTGKSSSL